MYKFEKYISDPSENVNKRILSAAHFYATKWEFDIIERANPNGYEIAEIKKNLQARQEKYYDLKGPQQLALYSNLKDFVDLCGDLRFQQWGGIGQDATERDADSARREEAKPCWGRHLGQSELVRLGRFFFGEAGLLRGEISGLTEPGSDAAPRTPYNYLIL